MELVSSILARLLTHIHQKKTEHMLQEDDGEEGDEEVQEKNK